MATASQLDAFDVPAVRPPAQNEQRALPIEGTIQGEYDVWRVTELGGRIYDVIRYRALALARLGETRIGMKALFEWARSQHRVSLDNNFTALVARELLDKEPELKGLIECRQRSAT